MSEFKSNNAEGKTEDESLEWAYAIAREVFDEQDEIEKAAARFFGVTVEYVRTGQTGLRPTPRIGNWMKKRYQDAGWKYLEE
jgi:hypothetical protein